MLLITSAVTAQPYPRFKVLAFYSRTVEKAHADFANDAIQFFKELTVGNGFVFDTTSSDARNIKGILPENTRYDRMHVNSGLPGG
jgi:hypothetical protein